MTAFVWFVRHRDGRYAFRQRIGIAWTPLREDAEAFFSWAHAFEELRRFRLHNIATVEAVQEVV
jgi:hypothetical protein